MTYEPSQVAEEYPGSIVPQIGEHVVISRPAGMEDTLHARVAALMISRAAGDQSRFLTSVLLVRTTLVPLL